MTDCSLILLRNSRNVHNYPLHFFNKNPLRISHGPSSSSGYFVCSDACSHMKPPGHPRPSPSQPASQPASQPPTKPPSHPTTTASQQSHPPHQPHPHVKCRNLHFSQPQPAKAGEPATPSQPPGQPPGHLRPCVATHAATWPATWPAT